MTPPTQATYLLAALAAVACTAATVATRVAQQFEAPTPEATAFWISCGADASGYPQHHINLTLRPDGRGCLP